MLGGYETLVQNQPRFSWVLGKELTIITLGATRVDTQIFRYQNKNTQFIKNQGFLKNLNVYTWVGYMNNLRCSS